MNWLDAESGRVYERPQQYVDEALRFDDVKEGSEFVLRHARSDSLVRFKVDNGKAVHVPE